MRSVLVTGGAGYVGSHACKALAEAGWLPVAYDDLSKGHRELVRWGPLEEGDIGDRERLAQTIERHRPEAVMHFAALAEVGESVRDPLATWRVNVAGTLALLETMRMMDVSTLILSSSCAVYGAPASIPISETAPHAPASPYGRSKSTAEALLADCGTAWGLKWTALRYFNAAGADPDCETGEDHRPETHLVPRALMAAAGLIPHLDLLGADWPTSDGTCVRDYVHVSDLACWHVAALERLLAGGAPAAFNLGSGSGFTVREVVAAAERSVGRPVPLRICPRRPGDVAALVADPTLARAELGALPRLSGLESIVESAWRWMRRRHL